MSDPVSTSAHRQGPGRAHPPTPTRILLADDQELMRMAFKMVIDSQGDLTVVGEAATGAEALSATAALHPDVILMDIRMPELDGVEATRRITASSSPARVIILTTFDLDEYVYAGLRAGASGFLLKDTPPAQLLEAIRVVAAGDAVVAPQITRRLLESFAERLPHSPGPAGDDDAGARARLASLTAREREVLTAVSRGLSNLEIAEELVLSEATIKSHVGRILAKLELRDRVQIVVYAYEHGLVATARD